MIDWKKIFKNPFKKKAKPEVTEADKEAFAKIILDRSKPKKEKKVKYTPPTSYTIRGEEFKIGDKVICRSNEPDPLWVGKILEFWDNEGKWSNPIPQVRDIRSGKVYGVMGIMKHYTDELMVELRKMKPLEQWNSLVPEEYRYSDEEIKRKEELYKRKKLPKKK